jgi:hypothetical protein
MIVIISISKLSNGRVQLGVAKPQHNSKPVQSYSSEKEARNVLLTFGVDEDATNLYLFKLLPQISADQELSFPPMDIPQHDLVSQGFEIDASARKRTSEVVGAEEV